MTMGIYKFTNKINNKVYVGQSVNIEKRYRDHLTACFNTNDKCYSTKFYRALRKHGEENFNREIIEEVQEPGLLNEKEAYWIEQYNSYKKGYNSTLGGDYVAGIAEDAPSAKLSNKEVFKIRNLLKNTTLSQEEITKLFPGITSDVISSINTGEKWKSVGDNDYPLRKEIIKMNGEKHHHSKLSDSEVLLIRVRYVKETLKNIYKDYKDLYTKKGFEKMIQGGTYKHIPIYKKRKRKWI